MSPILGIIASQNYPRITSSYESIATVTIGTPTSEINFTSISSAYKHLQIRAIVNTDRGSVENTYMRMNGVTSSDYNWNALYGNGSVAGATGGVNDTQLLISRYQGTTSTNFGGFILDILDYANTDKFKTYKSLSGWDGNGSGDVYFWGGAFRSTSAITSIRIYHPTNNFIQYSSFALYGIKD